MGSWMWTAGLAAFVVGSLLPDDHVGFVLEAVKSAQVSSGQGQGQFCFELESPFADLTSEFLFVVEVVDTLPFHTDTSRFGGTNADRGKQSLDMTIHNCANGDLVRGKRKLASGTSVIEVNPLGCRKFCFCFVNLSYDSSWKYIDVIKTITVKMATYDSIQKQQWRSQLLKEMTVDSIQQMEESTAKLLRWIDTRENSELLRLESDRRDLNEEVFDWLMYSELAFTIAVIVFKALVTRYFIKSYRKRVSDTRLIKKLNH